MDSRLGLSVLYTDGNNVSYPAIIALIHDDSSVVDLLVFVSEADGFRNDQTSVSYSATVAPNTWTNI